VSDRPPRASSVSWLRPTAWVLYDLANTVYHASLTFLFASYATDLFGATTVGTTQTASMALSAVLVPVFGAIMDRTVRTRGYLTIVTLLCIGALAGWGLGETQLWMLGCFFVANVAHSLALLFYNSLLPSVAEPARQGRISGIGTGVGYFGTVLVLAILKPLHVSQGTRFLLAAAMFLVLALPCLVLVRDQRQPQTGSAGSVAAALRSLGATLRSLPQHKPLLWFLLANFCLVDVMNTAILFFASFTTKVFRPMAERGELFLFGQQLTGEHGLDLLVSQLGLCLNGLALLSGIVLGFFTDRFPLRVMRCAAVALLGALVGGAVFGGTSPYGYLLTLVALGAFGIAGMWTAGRKVVILLAPQERIGEFFGLYGITVKLSVIGSSVYGIVADHFGAKPGMLAQSVQLCLGLVFLMLVRLPSAGADAPARVA
jgi:UMF1 family MFS transporter